jgi:hypothetical protein
MFDLREVYDTANRQNVAISTVDPRGLAATEFGLDSASIGAGVDRRTLTLTLETLKMLAENTDGRAIVSRNDLTIAMKQIVVDASAYYLLGYSSNVGLNDGKFHDIRVRVKRPRVEVRHRRGYWALKPEDAARLARPIPSASPSPVEAALAAAAMPSSRPVRTWIGAERGTDGKTRMTFVWEPVRNAARAGGSARPARVMLTARGTTGAPYFNGPVPQQVVAPTASGSRVTFDAPPGAMQLRIAVEGSDASVLDTELKDIAVPDFTPPRPLFGTPVLFSVRTLPEIQRLKLQPESVPTAAREFSRTERLLLRIPLYGPADTTPTLTASLVNRTGQTMTTLAVAPAAGVRDTFFVEIPLANLAPGAYGIALSAVGEGGGATELVAFRIAG